MSGATPEGTRAYAERHVEGGLSPSHFREANTLSLSSVGLGTYLGEADDQTDMLYVEAVTSALTLGCNVFDTASNYRYQRSERAIGAALARAMGRGKASRDEIVITTKGGYVPFDGQAPASAAEFRRYLEETFIKPGLCSESDFTTRGQHCMTAGYLGHQLDQSLRNLGVDSVEVYYIHNPEGQLAEISRDEFERRIRSAFELLESRVADGRIGVYGTATWNGYRVSPKSREALSLARLEELAREVGGADHHFRAIQLPFSLAMPEAYTMANQAQDKTVLELAAELGITVFASASLMQARLAQSPLPELVDAFGITNSAQAALQFVRSTPGVACSLVGMSRELHVRENLSIARIPVASAECIGSLFE